jgi:hypothetical protein
MCREPALAAAWDWNQTGSTGRPTRTVEKNLENKLE